MVDLFNICSYQLRTPEWSLASDLNIRWGEAHNECNAGLALNMRKLQSSNQNLKPITKIFNPFSQRFHTFYIINSMRKKILVFAKCSDVSLGLVLPL